MVAEPRVEARTEVVALVESETTPGKFYEVRRSKGGQLYCTCPAWRFARSMERDGEEFKAPCKHLRKLGVEALHRLEVPSWVFRGRS